jgi:hypothetical protein
LGLPNPRLCDAWLDEQNKEALVLEPVAVVEADHMGWLVDERNGKAFLSLLARFASHRVLLDYMALIGRDMAYMGAERGRGTLSCRGPSIYS